jgi:hypothetical protein
MIAVNVSWKSSEPLTDLEGYVLATLLRISHTGKVYKDRKVAETPTTALTDQLVDAIAGPFAYVMAQVGEQEMKTVRDVDVFMRWLKNNLRRAEVWLNANGKKRDEAHAYLKGLVGKFTCTG